MQKSHFKITRSLLMVAILLGCSDMGDPLEYYPQLLLPVNSLDFASVTVGATQERELEIINTGDADLNMEIQLLQMQTVFTVSPEGTRAIEPGDTLVLSIGFSPTGEDSYSASLDLSSDDPDQPEVSIPLTGSGTALAVPAISINPSQVTLGTLLSGSSTDTQITISSIGTASLMIDSIVTDIAGLSHDGSGLGEISAGGSELLTLTYVAGNPGAVSGTVNIHTNADSSPDVITLTATVQTAVSYASSVQPVFNANCTGCHGTSAGLSLTSYTNLMLGNSSNGPVVNPGDGAASLLIRKLRGTAGSLMPIGGPALPSTTIDDIETWIDQGALDN